MGTCICFPPPPPTTRNGCPMSRLWDVGYYEPTMRGHPERSPPQRTKPKDLHLFLSQTGGSRSLQAPQSQPQNNAGCPTLATFLFLWLGWDTTNPNRPAPYQGTAGRSGIHPRPPQPAHPFFLKIKYAAKPRSAPPAHLPCFSRRPPTLRDGCPMSRSWDMG